MLLLVLLLLLGLDSAIKTLETCTSTPKRSIRKIKLAAMLA